MLSCRHPFSILKLVFYFKKYIKFSYYIISAVINDTTKIINDTTKAVLSTQPILASSSPPVSDGNGAEEITKCIDYVATLTKSKVVEVCHPPHSFPSFSSFLLAVQPCFIITLFDFLLRKTSMNLIFTAPPPPFFFIYILNK